MVESEINKDLEHEFGNQDDDYDDINIQEETNEPENDIEDFNLDSLIIEGENAIVERTIDYFNIKTKKIKKMRVYVNPLPYMEMQQVERLIQRDKKNLKDIVLMVCSRAWVNADGSPITPSQMKQMGEGVPKAVYEEIKIVSGHTHDHMQDKFINKIAGF